jgi:hypothetical protein
MVLGLLATCDLSSNADRTRLMDVVSGRSSQLLADQKYHNFLQFMASVLTSFVHIESLHHLYT